MIYREPKPYMDGYQLKTSRKFIPRCDYILIRPQEAGLKLSEQSKGDKSTEGGDKWRFIRSLLDRYFPCSDPEHVKNRWIPISRLGPDAPNQNSPGEEKIQ